MFAAGFDDGDVVYGQAGGFLLLVVRVSCLRVMGEAEGESMDVEEWLRQTADAEGRNVKSGMRRGGSKEESGLRFVTLASEALLAQQVEAEFRLQAAVQLDVDDGDAGEEDRRLYSC